MWVKRWQLVFGSEDPAALPSDTDPDTDSSITMGGSPDTDPDTDSGTTRISPPPPRDRELPKWMVDRGYDDLSPPPSTPKTFKDSIGSTDGEWISAKRIRKNPHPKKHVPKKLPPSVNFNARKKDGSIQLINMRLPDHPLSKTLVKGKNSFDTLALQRLMRDHAYDASVFVQEVTKTMMTNTNTSKILSRDGGAYDYRWYKDGAVSQSLKEK